ncbi:MAG: TlpA disulfide reductase family protein [Dysosmobacter sp.]
MKHIKSGILAAVLVLGLTACASSHDELVTRTPFPTFSEVDTQGNPVTNDIFADYDATIVNFWNNGCGTCIAEMPELEEYYQAFKEENINLIGVASDSGESDEQLETAQDILEEKSVTYINLSPNPETTCIRSSFPSWRGIPLHMWLTGRGTSWERRSLEM